MIVPYVKEDGGVLTLSVYENDGYHAHLISLNMNRIKGGE